MYFDETIQIYTVIYMKYEYQIKYKVMWSLSKNCIKIKLWNVMIMIATLLTNTSITFLRLAPYTCLYKEGYIG